MGPVVDAVNDFIDPRLIYAELIAAIHGTVGCFTKKNDGSFCNPGLEAGPYGSPHVHVSKGRRA